MQDDPREKNEIEAEYYSILWRNLAWWKKRGIYVPKSDEGEERPNESARIDFRSHVPVDVRRDPAVFAVTIIAAIISLVGLFVLIKYTKAAFQQVSETQVANQQAKVASVNANNLGNDTLKEMQNGRRPWVGIGGNGSIRMEMLVDKPLRIELATQNFGSSPAFGLSSQIIMKIIGPIENNTFTPTFNDYSHIKATPPIVLFPTAAMTLSTDSRQLGPGIKQGDIEGIRHGTVRIYVYGTLRYGDSSQNKHKTDYCFTYDPSSLEPGQAFTACATHNYAD